MTTLLQPNELHRRWQAAYPDCPPTGYILRSQYRERWVRFHSLPGSRRYPESEDDYQTLLHRHNAVLSGLNDGESGIVLISTGYSNTDVPDQRYAKLQHLDPHAQHWHTIAKHVLDNDEEYPNYWHFFMSQHSWTPGIFDAILRIVADNTVANLIIVDP